MTDKQIAELFKDELRRERRLKWKLRLQTLRARLRTQWLNCLRYAHMVSCLAHGFVFHGREGLRNALEHIREIERWRKERMEQMEAEFEARRAARYMKGE